MKAASAPETVAKADETVPADQSSREIERAEEPYEGYLDQNAARFFYRWGEHLSETLVKVRRKFDGDLDQYLLYLIFLLYELKQSTGATHSGPRRGLNAHSLAEITQIPRETARRKLLALTERGFLERDASGLFLLSDRYDLDEFFCDLKPLFWDAVKRPADRGNQGR